jgi:hypothetical protein
MRFLSQVIIIFFIINICYINDSLSKKFRLKVKTKNHSIKNNHFKDGTISFDKLSKNFTRKQDNNPMTNISDAKQGDVLYFDQGRWMPAPLVGINFISGWNASSNAPELFDDGQYKISSGDKIDAVTGDYFVVSSDGSTVLGNQDSWHIGDWIIYNGNAWVKINNTGVVASIFGRVEDVMPAIDDYTWEQIDKSNSKLENISDTPDILTNGDDGKVIKWNDTQKEWELGEDQVGIQHGNVKSSDIKNDSITDAHISTSAEIEISKVNGLNGLLNEKLNISGGQLTGDLDLSSNKLIFDANGTINNKPIDEMLIGVSGLTLSMDTKENKFTISNDPDKYLTGYKDQLGERLWLELKTDLVTEGNTNKFFTTDKVLESELAGYQIGNSDSLYSTDTILEAFGKLEQKIKSFQSNLVISNNNIPEVTLGMLSTNMGSDNGLVNFGNNQWSLKMISGLQFKGAWDPTGSYPAGPSSGDYYIISVDRTFDGKDWKNGDWAIYNGTNWQQINNAGIVHSFNNRYGDIIPCPAASCAAYDYTWSMIDKTTSSITDLTDVDTSGATSNQVLKYDSSVQKWKPATDLAGSSSGSIASNSVVPNTIENIDIKSDADISQSKIKDLSSDLLAKFPLTGGTLTGDLNLDNNDLVGVATINSEDINQLLDSANNIGVAVDAKEDALTSGHNHQFLGGDKNFKDFNSDDITEGATNLYFTEARVLETPLLGYVLATNNFNIVGTDSILTAIGKISGRIDQGQLPHNSIGSDDITDKSITVSKFSTDNAVDGDTFVYDITDGWVLRPLSGMKYLGTWDLVADPNLPTSATKGDYYIISKGDTSWSEGDWAVYNEIQGISEWQRISNSKNLQSFNNREGQIAAQANDYSWSQLNFTGSSINSFTDVDTSGVVADKVLKWSDSSGKWVVGDDEEKVSNSITGVSFEDESVLPQHFKTGGIEVAHIKDLQTEIDEFYPIDGTKKLERGINLSGNNIINLGLINGIDVDDISNACGSLDPSIYQAKFTADPLLEFPFLGWPGTYKDISLDDLDNVSTSSKLYNSAGVLNLPLTGYVRNPASESLADGDTLLESFQKLEGRIDSLSSGGSVGFFQITTSTNLSSADNGKTFFASGVSTEILLPVLIDVADGYQITVKRVDDVNEISINGNGTNIDDQSSWSLSSNYASIKVIKENNIWLIIQKHGEVQ